MSLAAFSSSTISTLSTGTQNLRNALQDQIDETQEVVTPWLNRHILHVYRKLQARAKGSQEVDDSRPPSTLEKNVILITKLFLATIPLLFTYFFLPTAIPLLFSLSYEISAIVSGRRWAEIDFFLGAATGGEGFYQLCRFAKEGLSKGILSGKSPLTTALICLAVSSYFFYRYANRFSTLSPQSQQAPAHNPANGAAPQGQNPPAADAQQLPQQPLAPIRALLPVVQQQAQQQSAPTVVPPPVIPAQPQTSTTSSATPIVQQQAQQQSAPSVVPPPVIPAQSQTFTTSSATTIVPPSTPQNVCVHAM